MKFIGGHLTDAPDVLNQHLSLNVPLADNLIVAASRLLGARRFFDSRSSDDVRSVHDYFAAYQARAAILLVEYYNAKPESYPPAFIKQQLDTIEGNVAAQAGALKPRVPQNTVLDTKTGLMWMQKVYCNRTASIVPLGRLLELTEHPLTVYNWRLTSAATAAALPGLQFNDWSLPTAEEMHKLLSHRGNRSPYEWLANDAHMSPDVLSATQSHFWLRDTFSTYTQYYPGIAGHLCYELYSLSIAGTAERTCKRLGIGASITDIVEPPSVSQGTLYLRHPAPGEEYWWH
jgi:Protein of unknown function (DUF1566)